MLVLLLPLLLLFVQPTHASDKNSIEITSFDKLMGIKTSKLNRFDQKDHALHEKYRSFYLNRCHLFSMKGYSYKIPRVFHLIWVGPKRFPDASIKNIRSWQNKHPNWVIKFWTDDETRIAPVSNVERRLIHDIPFKFVKDCLIRTDNYGEQADLIRYEILYNEGGVYLDHDIECFESIDNIVAHFDFFAPIEPLHSSSIHDSEWNITNCIIGSRAGHPILKNTLESIQKNWEYWTNEFPESDRGSVLRRVLNRTFKPFGRAVDEYLGEGSEMLLPSAMIFPSHYSDRCVKELREKHLAFADHKWENTWFKEVPLTMEERVLESINHLKSQNRSLHKRVNINKLILLALVTAQCYLIVQIWIWKRKKHVNR